MGNFINSTIEHKEVAEILHLIKTIRSKMPFLQSEDSVQNKFMPKLEDEQIPFVIKCLHYTLKGETIVPKYIDANDFHKALSLFNNLQSIATELNQLTDLVNSTIEITGSDAFVAAMSIYNTSYNNMNASTNIHIQEAIEDLSMILEGKKQE